MAAKKKTPMEIQYESAKAEFPDAIMLIRVGDFFEVFGDDAVVASKVLGITLTSRDKNKNGTPMAGVPHHAVDAYVARLVRDGYRVALCDQLEDPKQAKGVVKRGVTKVITPGVVLEGDALEDSNRRLLGAVLITDEHCFAAWLDSSTGEAATLSGATLDDCAAIIERDDVFEWVVETAEIKEMVASYTRNQDFVLWQQDTIDRDLDNPALGLAAAYASHIQLGAVPALRVRDDRPTEFDLDTDSIINLDIFYMGLDHRREGSLYDSLNRTQTRGGGRMLADWLRTPLCDLASIHRRQSAVEALYDRELRSQLVDELSAVADLERLTRRIELGRVLNGLEWQAIRRSLRSWAAVRELLGGIDTFSAWLPVVDELDELHRYLEASLVESPVVSPAKGHILADAFSPALAQVRRLQNDRDSIVADLEQRLQQESGINNLKIRSNRVFGLYVEAARNLADQVPTYFVRKQTLANVERYEFDELVELGQQIEQAETERIRIESEGLAQLSERSFDFCSQLYQVAAALSSLDVLASFASVSIAGQWIVPEIRDSAQVDDEIIAGRHPALSLSMGDQFIPNTTQMADGSRMHILTGPNMGGKSTYLKQVGQLYLLAHIGCNVPAQSMKVAVIDQIFSRVGAGDDIARGESTFMVEMRQCARIVERATAASIVLLDEVGRGTSTFDGLSIAWALVHHLHDTCAPRTVFCDALSRVGGVSRLA